MGTALGANDEYYEEFADEYSLFFANLAANMEQEGDWLDGALCRNGVRTILDASCGAGRQAIPLVRRGYRVTGADPSPAMLREARREAQEADVDLPLYQSRFTELPNTVDGAFDAVITLGNSLCHQENPADIVSSLAAMRTCCRPQGLCLVGIKDFDTIRKERPRFHGHTIRDEAGERVILFEVWDFADTHLVCTAYSLRDREPSRGGRPLGLEAPETALRDREPRGGGALWASPRYRVHSAQTRERMVGADEFSALAREAGFNSIVRLNHPSEVVYELRF